MDPNTPEHHGEDLTDNGEVINLAAVLAYISTPYEEVYKVSDDGRTYAKPASLRGVPVDRIDEDSKYWQSCWNSLDGYLAQRQVEEDRKAQASARVDLDKDNQRFKDALKLHSDNVCKHKKIAAVFGPDQPCHPNQLVAKRYVPLNGLCEQETMYDIGNRVTDFQVLYDRGFMKMRPFDFVRWRMGAYLLKQLRGELPRRGASIKTVVHKITSERSADLLFRRAVLYSAKLQGRGNSFGSKKKTGTYSVNGQTQISFTASSGSSGGGSPSKLRSVLGVSNPTSPPKTQCSKEEKKQWLENRRQDRKRRVKEASRFGAGIKGYLKEQSAKKSNGGPCGG